MAVCKIVFALVLLFVIVDAQRPFYAGLRSIGYPELESNQLINRYNERDAPIQARGDMNLVQRLNAMPIDKQPFWYINWRQYAAMMANPKTYPLRPSVFADRV